MFKRIFTFVAASLISSFVAAQSNVTIFGIIDQSANHVRNGDATSNTMQSNQLNSNRLGFKGSEDLGGGLSAAFWIEAGMANENGTVGGSNGLPGAPTAIFNRKSTVSLVSKGWGEVRLGRDYTPTFINVALDDVNGANGMGNGFNIISTLGSGALTGSRDNNTVQYFLPAGLAGFYGQVMVGAGEGISGQKFVGGRAGWSNDTININVASANTKIANTGAFTESSVGGSYDFKLLKLFAFFNRTKWNALAQNAYELSISVPIGVAEIRGSFGSARSTGKTITNVDTDGNNARLMSLEFIYNLSKRTALYTTAAEIDNKGRSAISVLSAAPSLNLAGQKSTGINAGIRHIF